MSAALAPNPPVNPPPTLLHSVWSAKKKRAAHIKDDGGAVVFSLFGIQIVAMMYTILPVSRHCRCCCAVMAEKEKGRFEGD